MVVASHTESNCYLSGSVEDAERIAATVHADTDGIVVEYCRLIVAEEALLRVGEKHTINGNKIRINDKMPFI